MPLSPDRLVEILRETIVGSVRRDGPDLSARQMSVLLITCLEKGPHTVRGLATRLNVSKPAVTRSLDRLRDLGLAGRQPDLRDRRSVLVVATDDGRAYVNELRALMASARARRASTRHAVHAGRQLAAE